MSARLAALCLLCGCGLALIALPLLAPPASRLLIGAGVLFIVVAAVELRYELRLRAIERRRAARRGFLA